MQLKYFFWVLLFIGFIFFRFIYNLQIKNEVYAVALTALEKWGDM